jgi:hypothetical protein
MTFLVQFIQFRRGVPEVSRTLQLAATDAMAALARAKGRLGAGAWPRRTDALRVMDDGGRTLIDWVVPAAPVVTAQPILAQARPPMRPLAEPRTNTPRARPDLPAENGTALRGRAHLFAVGQAVAYAEDGKPEAWRGNYEIVELHRLGTGEPQYAIRNADQSYDRVVREHELREDLGARVRGL